MDDISSSRMVLLRYLLGIDVESGFKIYKMSRLVQSPGPGFNNSGF